MILDLKSLLNKEQYEGATTVDGQLLILAGAGSGKTRVLTYRMAHMIEDLGIQPYKILAITFTNKAAKEMRERVKALVGEKAEDMWISTFHSTCVRILRREIEHLGYKKSFTIYDTSDQKTLMTECMKIIGIDDKDISQREIAGRIGRAKDKLQGAHSFKREFEDNFRDNKIADVYLLYQKRLKENNALDFDDLIFKTVELFQRKAEVLEFYQRKFQYIMVDEYQDTNGAQYELVRLLAEKNKNICVVGDDDQCLASGTIIETEKGKKPIEDITTKDKIKAFIGNGKTELKEVSSISKKEYNGDIIEIKTKSGNNIKGTSNHITFAKINLKDNLYYVYLTYKKESGYDIKCTLGKINKADVDKLWIIKACNNKIEANSFKLNSDYDESKIMKEFNLYKDYPHYTKENLNNINITFFSEEDNSHKIEFDSNTTIINNYDEAEEFIRDTKLNLKDYEIIKKAKILEDEPLLFVPLGSVKKGMEIAVALQNKIVLEEVLEVKISYYRGMVYDINLNDVRNYFANNIAMHNCIYAWRGADVTNILDFEKDYPNAKVIKLEENYRSKGNILNAANVVIANNVNRKRKELRTSKELGDKIKIYRAFDDRSEADFVSKTISDLKYKNNRKNSDFAILYRTNAQSRIFEETLRRRGIAYKIVGGTRFYDRKEIKDLISYLKVLVNPQDDISLKRIINVPKRSIGDATVSKIQEYVNSFELNLWDGLSEVRNISTLTPRNATCIEKFTTIMNELMSKVEEGLRPSALIEKILNDTGYLEELKKSGEIEDKSRIENLKELVSDAADFEKNNEDKSLASYLERISLVQDTDKLEDESEDNVILMTIHSAKGLEFPIVFMVGMENGLFPSTTDIEHEDQMEEARRLCYVAITRAEEELYLTSAEMRRVFGRMVSYPQSEFVDNIKLELKEYLNDRGTTKQNQENSFIKKQPNNPFSLRNTVRTSGITPSAVSEFDEISLGRKVKHEKFGVGTVINIVNSGEDKKVTIAFDNQGLKVLSLAYAKLELL